MKNLIDALKIWTGRKLSEKEMKRAKESPISFTNSPTFALYVEGDQIIKIERYMEHAITRDVSHREIQHEGDYFVGSDKRYYNEKGLLIRKKILRNYPAGHIYRKEKIVYNKPGQFIGQKMDRYKNLIEAINLNKNDWLIVEASPEVYRYGKGYRVSHVSPKSNKPLNKFKFGN